METFDFFDSSEDYRQPQYAKYRSDPRWQRIYPFLKGKLLHVTSTSGWECIRHVGQIDPSGAADHGSRFAEHIVRHHFAFENNYVAMFDFEAPTEEEVIRTWDRSHEVITMEEPTVLIELDRVSLAGKLVPNSAGCVPGTEKLIGGNCIPFVEAWIQEPIPTSTVLRVYRVTAGPGLDLQWSEMDV